MYLGEYLVLHKHTVHSLLKLFHNVRVLFSHTKCIKSLLYEKKYKPAFKFHSAENNKSQSLTQNSSNKALLIIYIQTICIKHFPEEERRE